METNNELTARAYGCTFTLTLDNAVRPDLRAALLSRGFDGEVYLGVSKPAGRQRSVKRCTFYRSANPARGFVPVVIM